MKTKLLLTALLSFSFYLLSSQTPQGFNYQAIARDGANPLTDPIDVRITIQSDADGSIVFWQEVHSDVQPNEAGLFSLVIGKGTRQAGLANFEDIDWSVAPKYIKTEIDYGGWLLMGASELWSVPYSLIAKNLEGPVEKLGVTGTTTDVEEALFEVKNNMGQTVFAVYNEGVRVYVSDGDSKGSKGGFAIGGFGLNKADVQKYFVVKPDTVRIYIDDRPGKASKGGFAIGGFGLEKGQTDDYMRVDPDVLKAGKVDFLNITPLNTFIGELAGANTVPAASTDDGKYNTFIGYQSGAANTTGNGNIFLGYQSGTINQEGVSNVFIGNQAGAHNIGVGNYIGDYNVFIGYLSGYQNTDGQSNVFVGKQAGFNNTKGKFNSFLGQNTGVQSQEGNFNTYLGAQAAEGKKRGNNNVFIGVGSGATNYKGSGNIFIGYMAGYAEQDSGLLFIENSNSATPLIGGDFDANMVAVNGKPDPASANFQVNGTTRLGTRGTTISNIIKVTLEGDLPIMEGGSYATMNFSVPFANVNASVMVTPQLALLDGIAMLYCRVSSAGVVEARFKNINTSYQNQENMLWYITVIQ